MIHFECVQKEMTTLHSQIEKLDSVKHKPTAATVDSALPHKTVLAQIVPKLYISYNTARPVRNLNQVTYQQR